MEAQVTFCSEQRLSQAEFFKWIGRRPAGDVHHYELIQGRIVMSPPADPIHASIGSRLNGSLGGHVEREGLGIVLDGSAGYDLPSGDTLEPDVSFVSTERLAAGPELQRRRFARVVPDLVVEILSRSTALRDRTEKKAVYATNGVREYWLVDPDRHLVTVFHLRGAAFDDGTMIAAGWVRSEVLPKLRLRVEKLFGTVG